jgi:hypothetical protein
MTCLMNHFLMSVAASMTVASFGCITLTSTLRRVTRGQR